MTSTAWAAEAENTVDIAAAMAGKFLFAEDDDLQTVCCLLDRPPAGLATLGAALTPALEATVFFATHFIIILLLVDCTLFAHSFVTSQSCSC